MPASRQCRLSHSRCRCSVNWQPPSHPSTTKWDPRDSQPGWSAPADWQSIRRHCCQKIPCPMCRVKPVYPSSRLRSTGRSLSTPYPNCWQNSGCEPLRPRPGWSCPSNERWRKRLWCGWLQSRSCSGYPRSVSSAKPWSHCPWDSSEARRRLWSWCRCKNCRYSSGSQCLCSLSPQLLSR